MIKRFVKDVDYIFMACGAIDFRKQTSGLVTSNFTGNSYYSTDGLP